MVHAGNQKVTNKEQSPRVAEWREELRRKIAAHTLNAGAHATAILGLTLYRRTAPSPCYPAMFEPSLNVFVQGRKRITFAGMTYLCDESTFLLSSVDVPVVSQIVAASEDVPLLSLLLKLDMAVVREILSQEEFHAPDGSSPARGIAIGKTTVDLLKPFCRLMDLLDAPEDIPFLSNLIQREIVYRLLRGPHGERLRAIATLGAHRARLVPDVPTMAETGVPGFAILPWVAMFAPGKTPPEIVERLAREVGAAMKRPDVREGLERAAFESQSSTPAELGAFLKDQLNVWGTVAREAGLQAH